MKSQSLHNSTKKRRYDSFYRDVTAFHEVPLTPLFSGTQHHVKRPSMRDVIIEQPHICIVSQKNIVKILLIIFHFVKTE